MHHVAIMNAKWKLIPRILLGDKTIESRWYVSKFAPWDKIKAGDVVFFKDSGKPVTAKATVAKVLQFSKLTPKSIKIILTEYGGTGKISVGNIQTMQDFVHGKNYCILGFLESPQKVTPFDIDKTGFGNACAWLCTKSIESIKRPARFPTKSKKEFALN